MIDDTNPLRDMQRATIDTTKAPIAMPDITMSHEVVAKQTGPTALTITTIPMHKLVPAAHGGVIAIPANTMQAGHTYRITSEGLFEVHGVTKNEHVTPAATDVAD